MITGVGECSSRKMDRKRRQENIRGGVDLYEIEPPAKGDIVCATPTVLPATIIGSAGQVLVWPNFGCLIDAALTAPSATFQPSFCPLRQ